MKHVAPKCNGIAIIMSYWLLPVNQILSVTRKTILTIKQQTNKQNKWT